MPRVCGRYVDWDLYFEAQDEARHIAREKAEEEAEEREEEEEDAPSVENVTT